MAIPPQFIEELRNRLSIASVVGRRVRLQKRGRDHVGLCPFHNEKSPSFTVSEDKGFFHCFGCGAHGDVVGFVMRSEGLAFPEAVERLAGEAGLAVPQTSPEERHRAEQQASQHAVLEAAAAWFEAQLQAATGRVALDYLRQRGLQDETIARFRLGFAPDARTSLKDALMKQGIGETQLLENGLIIRPEDGRPTYDRFRGRVMFPIADRRGRVIAFGGRILAEGEPKYLNSPETPLFHKGRTLYGLAQAARAARDGGEIIVCEGYMDVIALAQAGFAAAVAPLGTALTEEQMVELWRHAAEPVLCFDGDSAGQRAAARAVERALPLLQPGKSLRFALLPAGDDPDTLVRGQGAAVMREVLDQARPLVAMLWELATSGRPTDTPERREGLRQRLREEVRRIGDRAVASAYWQEIDARLAAAFAPAGGWERPGNRSGRRRFPGPPSAVGGAAARLGTRHLEGAAERIALAIAVNHPHLIAEHAEELAQAGLRDGNLDRLRRAIISLAAGHPDLDAEGLRRHLTQIGFAEVLQGLFGKTRDIRVTQPTAPADRAAEELRHVLGLLREREAHKERELAERRLADDGTQENLARLDLARQATLDGESKRRDIDQIEALPVKAR
jgi:DNA primase